MSTLWKRATGPQFRMLRIVSGAVLNTQAAHGEPLDRKFARSVAKRAVGTLSSQWVETLAADKPPSSGNRRFIKGSADSGSQLDTARRRETYHRDETSDSLSKPLSKRRAASRKRRRLPHPLKKILKSLSAKVGRAKRDGRDEYARDLIEGLKLIGGYVKASETALRDRPHVP